MSEYPQDWPEIAESVKDAAQWRCIRCEHPHDPATGYCLTVHHLDGNKSNCRWWNLTALCQRCHLSVQARVVIRQQYPLEHKEWFKPYAAGWYAFRYLGEDLSRPAVLERLDELLALERRL
ncbi:MAG: HNH endonuclease [Planctomycetes bacterium]|nr:HNH endonuclease [Planctomycetota bacterium]